MNETERCHCGSPMHGSDHCPCCGCEEFETNCGWICVNPNARSAVDHSDSCRENN